MTKYTEEHEWLDLDGDIVTVGITEHAAEQLGDIVFIELPEVGDVVASGAEVVTIESVKAASDIAAPLDGEIVEINAKIVETLGLVNEDPSGEGWFFKVKIEDVGALAEFIEAKAIGCPAQTRNDWTAYDLVSPSGIKVEVKSSAYLQSWHQKRPSRPRFSIRKSLEWAPKTNEYVGQSRRHSDVYVFCLLSFRGDKHFLNPLDLTQWEFYVVRTADIDELFGDRQGISLREVQQLSQPYAVEEFPNAIESAATTP